MAKKKKSSEFFTVARGMGENIGKLVMETEKQKKFLVRTGRKGVEKTAEALKKTQKKAVKTASETAHETIPQLIKEFHKGLKRGMGKK